MRQGWRGMGLLLLPLLLLLWAGEPHVHGAAWDGRMPSCYSPSSRCCPLRPARRPHVPLPEPLLCHARLCRRGGAGGDRAPSSCPPLPPTLDGKVALAERGAAAAAAAAVVPRPPLSVLPRPCPSTCSRRAHAYPCIPCAPLWGGAGEAAAAHAPAVEGRASRLCRCWCKGSAWPASLRRQQRGRPARTSGAAVHAKHTSAVHAKHTSAVHAKHTSHLRACAQRWGL